MDYLRNALNEEMMGNFDLEIDVTIDTAGSGGESYSISRKDGRLSFRTGNGDLIYARITDSGVEYKEEGWEWFEDDPSNGAAANPFVL